MSGGTATSSPSNGFRSFWKKSSQDKQNVTFVQQDPSNKRKQSRISRILKQDQNSPTGSNGDVESGTPEAQKRRLQVYRAQKRHRDRKSEYVRNLEAEVARLQKLDAMVNSEKNALAHQNRAIKQLLASQSLDAQLDSVTLTSSSAPSDDLSQLGTAMVDVRFDSEVGHERAFLDVEDLPEMYWTSSETSGEDGRPRRRSPGHEPVAGDSWAALDFILALEWPCREHVKHHAMDPVAKVPAAHDVGEVHGHALTATSAVFHSARPANPHATPGLPPGSSDKWQLPHSEIDKLVKLSEQLDLDDEIVTPAQAYAAIRESVPHERFLRPLLAALKKPLGSLVQCHGFGACMDTQMFWQQLDSVTQSLRLARPELEHDDGLN